ncbi:hypothetical protein [Streptomyces hiroshimensis]|uniref:hypothetical protein n=1 Tax=Streptomyces hiroshimensis TaxID=66424 RepID=UPI001673FCD7|nr:hypothetical protein [Streptomyces hiroshimensis]
MGVRRPEESTCVLTYTVETDPAPIQVSQGTTPATATLRITVTNHQQTPVHVEEVRFSYPVGSGPGDLTAKPDSGVLDIDDGQKWVFERDSETPAFILRPRRPNRPFPSKDQVEVSITGIEVNPAVGTSKLTVTETLQGGGEPRQEEWPLAKVPAGFTVSDFRPTYILVRSGSPAELTWRGTSRDGATYTMLHGGDPVDVTGIRNWPTPNLHRDTAFVLAVEVDVDGNVAEYALTTAVTVARPDLTIGDLTVHGKTTLTHLPTEFGLGEADELTYTAETDGFLTGQLVTEEDAPGDDAPTLTVTVSADGTDRLTSVQSRHAPPDPEDPRFPGSRLTAVVPRGARVTIGRSGTAPSRHLLSWLPFGTGELKPVDP